MTLGTGRAKREPLCDVGFEFPSISYRRVSGRRQRFVWGASIGSSTPGQPASQIVRVDLERSTVDRFVCDEPVFVAAPSRAAEDDGVILTVGSDPAAPRAMLVALDARDLRLIASAAIDVPLPLGFHGSFQRDSGGDKSRE
jgi:carotenoid cleavage dioxygenase-like enzyme